MKLSGRKLRLAAVAAVAAAGLAAASCSSTANPGSPGAGTGAVAKGGTATIALPAGVTYSNIFPFYGVTEASVYNLQFQYLFFRPLYMFGNNTDSSVAVNYPLSSASPPQYSNGGKTVVVNMKGWKWSDGESVDAKSLIFFLNMAEAEKANWYGYSKGLLPDDLVSYKATGPNQVTFQLNKAYSSLWFTYNQLGELKPMPMAWDVTSLTGKPNSGGCVADSQADNWAKCKAVYTFLTAQSKIPATYASSRLWSVVDGPWKLTSFSTTGNVTIVPNKAYSGSPKPQLSAVKFLPYTADTTEYTALKTGQLNVGYVPSADLPQRPASSVLPATNPLGSAYNLQPFYFFGITYAQPNFNNSQIGFIVRQLYVRQALQSAFDQPGIIKAIYRGYAVPASGPARERAAREPVDSGHPDREQQPGSVPVQHRQGEVAADQPRLGHAGRRHDLPGPGQVRYRHQAGPAAEADLHLLHRPGRHRGRCGRPTSRTPARRASTSTSSGRRSTPSSARPRRARRWARSAASRCSPTAAGSLTARASSQPASRCSRRARGQTPATTPTRRWTT